MAADGLLMGLDIASVTGVATGKPGDTPNLFSVRFMLEDDMSPTLAFGRAVAWMAKQLLELQPIAVYVEAAIPDTALHGRTHHNAQMLKIGLYGALTGVARAKSIPVFAVNIGKYRKAFTGHGGLAGDEGKKFVFRECQSRGWNPPNFDASDAAGVWWYGCTQSDSLYQTNMKF